MFSIIAAAVENAQRTLVAESEAFRLQSAADGTSTSSGAMPSATNVAGVISSPDSSIIMAVVGIPVLMVLL
jgi:hypothetical protein